MELKWTMQGDGELTGTATSLYFFCGVRGGGSILRHSLGSRHSCDQQQLQSPRMGEHELSLVRPGRQPPAPPATLLAMAGRDRDLSPPPAVRFEQVQRGRVS